MLGAKFLASGAAVAVLSTWPVSLSANVYSAVHPVASLTAIQSFPKLPKVKVPRLPTVRSGRGSARSQQPPGANNRELQMEYRSEVGKLAYLINTNWSSKADNERIEKAVAEYRDRVNLVASDRFASLSATQKSQVDGSLRAFYDTMAKTAEREAAWAEQKISNIGVADAAYNEMLVHFASLEGAVTLYPENSDYAAAKEVIGTVLQKFGNRAGANQQKDAVIMAKARAVKMPPAITRSQSAENQFRQAWGTSGIPYKVRKVHIRSGWAPKRNALGIVIGQVRDAAIAVEDPATGHCYLYDFTMIKEGGNVRRSSHAAKRMACENIPA